MYAFLICLLVVAAATAVASENDLSMCHDRSDLCEVIAPGLDSRVCILPDAPCVGSGLATARRYPNYPYCAHLRYCEELYEATSKPYYFGQKTHFDSFLLIRPGSYDLLRMENADVWFTDVGTPQAKSHIYIERLIPQCSLGGREDDRPVILARIICDKYIALLDLEKSDAEERNLSGEKPLDKGIIPHSVGLVLRAYCTNLK